MFVKWRKKPAPKTDNRKSENHRRGPLLIATLVERVREDGKVRQRHIAFIGSIRENEIGHLWRRLRFWRRASRALEGITGRRKIEAELKKRIPKPTKTETAASQKRVERLIRMMSRQ